MKRQKSLHVLHQPRGVWIKLASFIRSRTDQFWDFLGGHSSPIFQCWRGSVWNVVDGRRSSRCPNSDDFVFEKRSKVISRVTSSLITGYLAKCVMECLPQAPCVAFTRCNFVAPLIAVLHLVQHAHRLHLVLLGTPVCLSTRPSKASFCCSYTPASCTAVGVVPGCSLLNLVTDLHDWAVLIK